MAAEARKEQTGSKVLLGKIQGAFFSKREGEGMAEKVGILNHKILISIRFP